MSAATPTPEVHVVVLWERARERTGAVVSDLASRFRVLRIVEVSWSAERFADNLSRFYGDTLPPGSEKERECGTGPLLVIVVEDPEPRYGLRVTNRGRECVHLALHDAKRTYRRWTGGGHKVHATSTAHEGAKDLYLLLGLEPDEVSRTTSDWDGSIEQLRADLLGADGWVDVAQLVKAVSLTVRCVARGPLDAPGMPVRLLVDDGWWAARIVGGTGNDVRRRTRIGPDERDVLLEEPIGTEDQRLLADAPDPSRAALPLRPVDRVATRLRRLAGR